MEPATFRLVAQCLNQLQELEQYKFWYTHQTLISRVLSDKENLNIKRRNDRQEIFTN
jgi:hypothetical protein